MAEYTEEMATQVEEQAAAAVETVVENDNAQVTEANEGSADTSAEAVTEEKAAEPAKPAKEFKSRTVFVVEDENGEHEFRNKADLDKFLARPRFKKIVVETFPNASDEIIEFLIDNEAAITALFKANQPEKKKITRELSPEQREAARQRMLQRIAEGKITPGRKKKEEGNAEGAADTPVETEAQADPDAAEA